MKLVIAVSHVDLKLAAQLVTRLKKIGGFENRFILVTSTWKDSFDAKPIADYVRSFAQTHFLVTSDPEEDKWPEAPTHLFRESAQWLHEQGNTEPWFMFEPDCAPLRPDFMDSLIREYNEAGKPYMGIVHRAILMRKSTGEFFPGEEHMVGAGIYPANFLDICPSIEYVTDWPWDVTIGEEVVPLCHKTSQIAHRWSTHKWVQGEDGLYHGQLTDRAKEINSPQPKPVTPEHTVIHGSKDDSIYKLALFPSAG